jgi:hypothetical protein
MREFVGFPDHQLAALTAVVPDHVILTNGLT